MTNSSTHFRATADSNRIMPMWRRLATKLWQRLGNTTTARSLIFFHKGLETLPASTESEPYLRLASPAEVRTQRAYCDGWYSQERALARLEEGCQLFILQEDGTDACFGWLEWMNAENLWVRLPFSLPRDVAYATGLYTTPASRGRGLMLRLYAAMAHRAKKQGARHLFAVVDVRNTASRRLHQRLGFQEYQEMAYRRCFFVNCYSVRAADSEQHRRWITLLPRGPADLWRAFWPGRSGSTLSGSSHSADTC